MRCSVSGLRIVELPGLLAFVCSQGCIQAMSSNLHLEDCVARCVVCCCFLGELRHTAICFGLMGRGWRVQLLDAVDGVHERHMAII